MFVLHVDTFKDRAMFVLRSRAVKKTLWSLLKRSDRTNLTPLMAVLVPITRVISSVTVHLMLNLKKKKLNR